MCRALQEAANLRQLLPSQISRKKAQVFVKLSFRGFQKTANNTDNWAPDSFIERSRIRGPCPDRFMARKQNVPS